MVTFLYKCYDEDYNVHYGSLKFSSEQEAYKHLDGQGYKDIEIFQSKTPYKNRVYAAVSAKELSIFCKQISVMVFSNITLIEGVEILIDQGETNHLKDTLTEMQQFMENGYSFSEAISMYPHIFGSYLVQMVAIGEQSGNLDTVLSDMSFYFEKEHETNKKIKGAVIYPVTLCIMMFAIIIFLVKSILPMFDSILLSMGAETSLITDSIMTFSNFIDKFFILFIIFVLVIIFGLYMYFKTDRGSLSLDKKKATIPVVEYITKRVTTAKFSRSLSVLLRSGVDILSALDKSILLVDNKYYYEKICIANDKIKEGTPIATALGETEIFPKLFIKMIVVGEKTGNLDTMLLKTTEIFEEEAYDAINRTTKLIEPILITILSIVIGIVLFAIMMPMINIMSSI